MNIVRDACQHEILGKYIHKVMFEELLETLNLPKEELVQFGNDVMERFNNPFVDHSVVSIMLNSFPKYETRDLPGLKVYLERKRRVAQRAGIRLAAIITYYKGYVRTDERNPNRMIPPKTFNCYRIFGLPVRQTAGRRRCIGGDFHLGRRPEPHSGIDRYGERFSGCHSGKRNTYCR